MGWAIKFNVQRHWSFFTFISSIWSSFSSSWFIQLFSVSIFTLFFSKKQADSLLFDSSVWDWKNGTPLSVIDNNNPPHSRITDMKFLNEEDEALLLTGSGKNFTSLTNSKLNKKHHFYRWRSCSSLQKLRSRASSSHQFMACVKRHGKE